MEKNTGAAPGQMDRFFIRMASIGRFTGRFFREVWLPPYESREVLRQIYVIGYQSLVLISITAFITGIVFTRQSRPSLVEFGAQSWLPALVSIGIVRAIGPLVTALICAGKVGSNIGAELASMRVTEQIDAMEVSGTKPFKFLVCTRVIATTISTPLLTIYANTISLMGSFLSVNLSDQTSFRSFFIQVFEAIEFLDIVSSISKAVFFGLTIGLVGCYVGYHSARGTEGVGKAANAAVVTSMFLIFIIDLLALQITNLFRV